MGETLRRWAVLACLTGLLAGCSRGGEPTAADDTSEPSPADSEAGLDRSREFMARVQVRGTGAAAFTWEGEQEIVLTRVGGPTIDVNLLSAGFALPEILPDDRAHRFRWAFDLLNAYGDEPGTFTIDAAPVSAQGLKSTAFLIWMKVKDPSQEAVHAEDEVEFLKHFGELRQPCTVEIGEGERTGRLSCQELATSDGEVAGLEVSWAEVTG